MSTQFPSDFMFQLTADEADILRYQIGTSKKGRGGRRYLLEKTLIRKGWEEGKTFRYFEAEGAEHNERAWAARIDQILEFLFPKKL